MRLWRFERRWLVEVFQTILPSRADPQLSLGAADLPIDRFIDDLTMHAPRRLVLGLRLALWVVVFSPLVLSRRLRTFFGLGRADRVALLDRLRQSRWYLLRELPVLLKSVACLGYCGHPAVQAQIGIRPIDERPPSWAQ